MLVVVLVCQWGSSNPSHYRPWFFIDGYRNRLVHVQLLLQIVVVHIRRIAISQGLKQLLIATN